MTKKSVASVTLFFIFNIMNGDSDKTIIGKMETIKHIHRVRQFLYMMIEELDKRARLHDQSKLVCHSSLTSS